MGFRAIAETSEHIDTNGLHLILLNMRMLKARGVPRLCYNRWPGTILASAMRADIISAYGSDIDANRMGMLDL